MRESDRKWTLLAYKLPPQPTRLRIQIWRKLQALGAVYLQDGVAVLPSREDLDENLTYISAAVEEMDGSATLLQAAGISDKDHAQIIERFQRAADLRLTEIIERLDALSETLEDSSSPEEQELAEDGLKRERVAYLKARRLNYFGSAKEREVDTKIEAIRIQLDQMTRGLK